jgi:hypothetical protein
MRFVFVIGISMKYVYDFESGWRWSVHWYFDLEHILRANIKKNTVLTSNLSNRIHVHGFCNPLNVHTNNMWNLCIRVSQSSPQVNEYKYPPNAQTTHFGKKRLLSLCSMGELIEISQITGSFPLGIWSKDFIFECDCAWYNTTRDTVT